MSKNYWVAFAGVALIAAGLAWYLAVPDEEERPTLANPASVHCERDLGGTLEIVEGQDGQQGLCHLPDGRVCEEWALYQSGACVTGEGTPTATSTPPAPRPATTTPSGGGDTAAMNSVRAQASTDFGVVESVVMIVSATPHDWPDSCLGLPALDEMCSQVVTAGYEVTVSVNGTHHVYRTNLDGSFVRKAS